MESINWDLLADNELADTAIKEVKKYLMDCKEPISTNALVEAIYPAIKARGFAGAERRQKVYKAILSHTERNLAAYCEKGAVTGKAFGKPKRPWVWRKPQDIEICVLCGSEYHKPMEK